MCVNFSGFDLELHWLNSNEVSQLGVLCSIYSSSSSSSSSSSYYYYYYYYYFRPNFARTNSQNQPVGRFFSEIGNLIKRKFDHNTKDDTIGGEDKPIGLTILSPMDQVRYQVRKFGNMVDMNI